MALADLYRQELLDHYKNPQNFGQMKRPDVVRRETNTFCGDVIKLFLKLNKKGKMDSWIVDKVSFTGVGCAVSLASASMVTEAVKGMTLQQMERLDEMWVQKLLKVELTSSRIKCAMLPVMAVKEAVKQVVKEETGEKDY